MNVAIMVWQQITLRYLENPYESMLRHMAAVVEANGGHTNKFLHMKFVTVL
jgi:hypothetical protein